MSDQDVRRGGDRGVGGEGAVGRDLKDQFVIIDVAADSRVFDGIFDV